MANSASAVPILSLDQLKDHTRGHLGLIIGPGATSVTPDFWQDLSTSIASKFGVEKSERFDEVAERAVHHGANPELVRAHVAEFAQGTAPSAVLSQLAKIRWTAVISFALDDHFETRLEAEHLRRPARSRAIVLSSSDDVARPGAVPIYKVLGSSRRGDLAVTTADVLRRTTALPSICRDFRDLVKASPVLCIGMGNVPWLTNQLIASLFHGGSASLGQFIVLAEDTLLANPTALQLVPRMALVGAAGTIVDVARAVEPTIRNRQVGIDFSASDGKPQSIDLSDFSDLCVSIGSASEPTIGANERSRLLDYLFMPDLPIWDPYQHGLDFERTQTSTVLAELDQFTGQSNLLIAILHGRAASGKTTILKRVALDRARAGNAVFWLRDYRYGDVSDRIEKFLQKVAQSKFKQRLDLFVDSSLGNYIDTAASVAQIAVRSSARVNLIVGVRTSELPQIERELLRHTDQNLTQLELSDSLDDREWAQLPAYLVKLGVANSLEQAKADVSKAEAARNTRDSLAILHWLLPQTRQMISQSIQQEYLTLGNSSKIKSAFAQMLRGTTGSLKDAYGMVAVASHYGVPLPVEILTHALGISYSEWLSTVADTGPAWGLFYSANDDDAETASYVTRNDVVTDTLLRTINGGALSHGGEVAIMKKLLGACDSTNQIYEKFCKNVLVPHAKLKGLSLAEGMELYDAAEKALPLPSRSILHHKGIWIRQNGGDLDDALQALDAALSATSSPHDERDEVDEHIHTSKAAAILDKIERNKISEEDGRRAALLELERSRSPRFVNPHATHVYAKLVSKLAFGKSVNGLADRFELINRGLADLDRMVLFIRSGGARRHGSGKDMELLIEARERIVANCVESDQEAEDLWATTKSQLGFVVSTRKKIAGALAIEDAGKVFRTAFDYWDGARKKVAGAGVELSAQLAEVGLVLYYSWQVHPRSRRRWRTVQSPIDWELLRDLAARTLTDPRFARDPFYRFVCGAALCHLKDWGAAEIQFGENRRLGLPNDVLHKPRTYLIHPEGTPWPLQGRLKSGASNPYFDAVDLRHQFVTSRNENWPRGNALFNAFVVLSFAGPLATRVDNLCREA